MTNDTQRVTIEQAETVKDGTWGWSDYEALIGLFGLPIIYFWRGDDYQGDAFAVLQDGERYGLIVFGFGSCSGCDALQACETGKDAADLANAFWESTRWFASIPKMLLYVNSDEAALNNYWRSSSAIVRELNVQLAAQS